MSDESEQETHLMFHTLNLPRVQRSTGQAEIGELDMACRVDEEVLFGRRRRHSALSAVVLPSSFASSCFFPAASPAEREEGAADPPPASNPYEYTPIDATHSQRRTSR